MVDQLMAGAEEWKEKCWKIQKILPHLCQTYCASLRVPSKNKKSQSWDIVPTSADPKLMVSLTLSYEDCIDLDRKVHPKVAKAEFASTR